jgi:hypothetical protein
MSLDGHVEALKRKHQELEWQLAEAQAHPSVDDLTIADLKRRKLLVKDQIAAIQAASISASTMQLPMEPAAQIPHHP